MKKLALTIVIVLGLGISAFADGGLFQRGYNAKNGFSGYNYFGVTDIEGEEDDLFVSPLMPIHGLEEDQNAPVGSGIVVLMGLGAAYMVAKKRKED